MGKMIFRGSRWRLPALLAVLAAWGAPGSTNNLALTPPMGWNSWNNFGCSVSESIIENVANEMAVNGMQAAGMSTSTLTIAGWCRGRATG